MEARVDTLIIDPHVSERLIEERRVRARTDSTKFGRGRTSCAPNDEHQDLVGGLIEVLRRIVDRRGLGKTRPAVNLASDPNDWEHDYRVPDVAVFLNDSPAICHGAFWSGPPDLLIEITSPFDKTRDKVEFYARLGTRELLIIDRDPWQLVLHRLAGGSLAPVANITPGAKAAVVSSVLPLEFRLLPGQTRPTIDITATDRGRSWTV